MLDDLSRKDANRFDNKNNVPPPSCVESHLQLYSCAIVEGVSVAQAISCTFVFVVVLCCVLRSQWNRYVWIISVDARVCPADIHIPPKCHGVGVQDAIWRWHKLHQSKAPQSVSCCCCCCFWATCFAYPKVDKVGSRPDQVVHLQCRKIQMLQT
jgi:hypothetical protein